MPKWLDDLRRRAAEYAKSLRARVLGVLAVVALGSTLLGGLWTGDWGGVVVNLGTELVGAVVTYVLLEMFLGRAERREAKKADLIAQMGSQVKDVAVAAAEELRRHGWLHDGSLQEADLWWANLQEADLRWANLQGANLIESNLQKANLIETNLQEADLTGARLQEADLWWANLQEADLRWANLQGANLQEADLGRATFNENTTLPDGTKWTPDTDMARFTDPGHPDFWRPVRAAATEDGHSPDDSSTDSVTYHVYENYPTNKARIHFSHCRYCNNGEGTQGRGRKTENGEWHGPFDTFQEALDAANATGRNVSTCKHCNPQ